MTDLEQQAIAVLKHAILTGSRKQREAALDALLLQVAGLEYENDQLKRMVEQQATQLAETMKTLRFSKEIVDRQTERLERLLP